MDSDIDYLLEQCAGYIEQDLISERERAEADGPALEAASTQLFDTDSSRERPDFDPPRHFSTLDKPAQAYQGGGDSWRGAHGNGRLSLPSPNQRLSHPETSKRFSNALAFGPPQYSSPLLQVPASTPSRHYDGARSSSTGLHSSPSIDVSRRRNGHSLQGLRSEQQLVVQCTPPASRTLARPIPRLASSPTPHIPPGRLPSHQTPVIQGIKTISTNELPDRFRSVFPFPLFNAIQSKCFHAIFETDENVVLAAPTGGGKTAVLELAICRLVSSSSSSQFKIVYQAPTKSLCAERQRDWQSKFAALDLKCAELTGDTDQAQLWNVQNASIIITTPEKWDSMTRKWKDHIKLMQMVKLFLIDEVHILKETRGATLEAVVSRMKSVGSNVRFVALSATVPNSEDVAVWLGRGAFRQHLPAQEEKFGEEFRPVKLQKFVYGYQCSGNDFAFDETCETKLPAVIAKHSSNKPIMIFCCTRNSAITTAKDLGKLWATKPHERHWSAPSRRFSMSDKELQDCTLAGVAFHHAGLESGDRHVIEKAYLEGQISVICCTSTLAVGVNLPCHLVILKNTVSWQSGSLRECTDLEVMQMMGRAGRSQFDTTGVAVIMTRLEKVRRYERMVTGEDILESCLHLNLIEHLNAEIGLGTVQDMQTAIKWLQSTFLYVRLMRNLDYYQLSGDFGASNIDDKLELICAQNIGSLQDTELLEPGEKLKCTEFGDAMARYYLKFGTMRTIMGLDRKTKMSDILSCLAMAEEFKDLRSKSAEKALYKDLNGANGMRYPIKVDLALPAHKCSIIIQAELGGVEYPANEQFQKHRLQYQTDRSLVFQHVHRLIRCIVDCQLHRGDAVTARHSLELARSLAARVWDNSSLQMKQIDQIGIVAVRKLAAAGVNSIEALSNTEAHRIETILSRNPPFGHKVLAKLQDFPRLTVTARIMGKDIKANQPLKVKVKAKIGFLNQKTPLVFNRKPIYVCYLSETSDGDVVDFGRISSRKLANGQDVMFTAPLTRCGQFITLSVMCEEIAGSMCQVLLTPDIPASFFPAPEAPQQPIAREDINKSRSRDVQTSGCRSHPTDPDRPRRAVCERDVDEYLDDDYDGDVFEAALGDLDFSHIDGLDTELASQTQKNTKANRTLVLADETAQDLTEPKRLHNGNWACNHKCKDKTMCKHFCCRDGLDKPPKLPREASLLTSKSHEAPAQTIRAADSQFPECNRIASTLKPQGYEWKNFNIEYVDLTRGTRSDRSLGSSPAFTRLDRLHTNSQKSSPVPTVRQRKPTYSCAEGVVPELSFLKTCNRSILELPDSSWTEDLPSPSELSKRTLHDGAIPLTKPGSSGSSQYGNSISSLEEGLVGLDDSVTLKDVNKTGKTVTSAAEMQQISVAGFGVGGLEMPWSSSPSKGRLTVQGPQLPRLRGTKQPAGPRDQALFVHNTSSDLAGWKSDLSKNGGRKRKRNDVDKDASSSSRQPLEEGSCRSNYDTVGQPDRSRKRVCLSDYGFSSSDSVGSPYQVLSPARDKMVHRPTMKSPEPVAQLEGFDPDLLAEFKEIVDLL